MTGDLHHVLVYLLTGISSIRFIFSIFIQRVFNLIVFSVIVLGFEICKYNRDYTCFCDCDMLVAVMRFCFTYGIIMHS